MFVKLVPVVKKMEINIIIFGQLRDLLGENLVLWDIADTDMLTIELNKRYPVLADSQYMMALNKKLVTENIPLTSNCSIALLPAFSGG